MMMILVLMVVVLGQEISGDYQGRCKRLLDDFNNLKETCNKKIADGDFVLPTNCSKIAQFECDKIFPIAIKLFPKLNLTKEQVKGLFEVQICVATEKGFIKGCDFDYEELKQFLRKSGWFENDKETLDKLIALINEMESHDKQNKSVEEFLESDFFQRLFEICDIEEGHVNI